MAKAVAKESLDESDVRVMAMARSEELGGVRAMAKDVGVSPSYISDFLNGRRGVGKALCGYFGLRMVTTTFFEREA